MGGLNLLHFLELLCNPWDRRHKELPLFSQHHEINLVRGILGQIHAKGRVTRVRRCLRILMNVFCLLVFNEKLDKFLLVFMKSWTKKRGFLISINEYLDKFKRQMNSWTICFISINEWLTDSRASARHAHPWMLEYIIMYTIISSFFNIIIISSSSLSNAVTLLDTAWNGVLNVLGPYFFVLKSWQIFLFASSSCSSAVPCWKRRSSIARRVWMLVRSSDTYIHIDQYHIYKYVYYVVPLLWHLYT